VLLSVVLVISLCVAVMIATRCLLKLGYIFSAHCSIGMVLGAACHQHAKAMVLRCKL